MTDTASTQAAAALIEKKISLINELADKFNEFKKIIGSFGIQSQLMNNVFHYLDTASLWLPHAINDASTIATDAETLGVPMPETVQVVADVVNDIAKEESDDNSAAVVITDATPTT